MTFNVYKLKWIKFNLIFISVWKYYHFYYWNAPILLTMKITLLVAKGAKGFADHSWKPLKSILKCESAEERGKKQTELKCMTAAIVQKQKRGASKKAVAESGNEWPLRA